MVKMYKTLKAKPVLIVQIYMTLCATNFYAII